MRTEQTDWKALAKVIAWILAASIFGHAVGYFQYRYSWLSPLIPESVMIQAAKPYLVGIIASMIATIAAWTFYYFSKYKITALIGAITFAFDYMNYHVIGESWNS